MSIFSNFKINSLRKKIIEDTYESHLISLAAHSKHLPESQKMGILVKSEIH